MSVVNDANQSNRAFDVEAATQSYLRSLSPEHAALGGLDVSKGVACGDSRAAMIGRSAGRFVKEAKAAGTACAEQVAAVVEEARNPIYRANASAIADEIGAHARIAKFKTKDALRDLGRRTNNAMNAIGLTKFVSPGSRIATLGKPRTLAIAAVAAAVLVFGASNQGVVAMSTLSPTASADMTKVGRTAEQFPIMMKQSSAGFASRTSLAMPGERFEQEALESLTLDFGDEIAAREHLDLTLAVLNTCVELPVPCTVHTAGLDLDPAHGRYIVSRRAAEGHYDYSFMSYDGHDVALDGQDGYEPVENPYAWSPGR